ncbi:MAG: hypothetical protein EA384_01820 [Spirochaetaceae bacterium]|nr:MAG: hypothetical protein EA384_01820 [Spirochaetaceae bacterium]
MAHGETSSRRPDRQVTLSIDGSPVQLNGFVKDVFQEVVVGLVRSLGDEDPAGRIELLVGPEREDN